MSKKELRENMISTLKTMDPSGKDAAANNITTHAKDYIKNNGFKSVGIVLPMKIEYDTWKLIDELFDMDVDVYSPVCHYDDKSMSFHLLTSKEEVALDEKNIPIPNPEGPVNNDVDLLIVPGLIFSPDGYRIGYGGGFYDRFLTTFNGATASLIFSEQIGETIVMDHDLPVDALITDKEIFNVKEVREHEE